MDSGGYYKKRGGYYKNYYNKYNNNNRNYRPQQKDVFVKRIDKVTKSDENGFTGNPSTWFSDEEFFKKMQGTSDYEHKKDYYFHSYSSFYIHEEMLKDRIRTESYMKAIESNKECFKDKVVLDIGCGTGVLSIFAARAGAKKVYGIEFADIADYAKKIVADNGLSDKITIIQSKVEEANVPEKVDIIISEWMGYFLLFESMLDCVLFARDKWLKPNGKILPDKATMYLAALEDSNYKSSKLDFWDNVYDVNMECIKPNVICEPLVDNVERRAINSSQCKILELDLNTCKVSDVEFASEYKLTFFRKDTCSGLCGWFDIEFGNLPNKVQFTTGPFGKWTHWKETIFYTNKDFQVEKGDVLKGSIAVRKSLSNFRELDVKISYHVTKDEGKTEKEQWYQLYKIR